MRAIVLVGGEATRMRPLSYRTPKQLMPVLHRPLLVHLLSHLVAHGVNRVTLAMLHRNEAIRDALGDGSDLGIDLDYTYEEQPLGSGGAIAQAAAGWDEPFMVCNGDIITDLDVTAMIHAHRERGAQLSISLHEVEDPSAFGVVVLGDGDRVTRFVEKPPRESAPSHLVNAGTWLFDPSLLAEMDATRFNRVEDELFPRLAAEGRAIFGFRSDAYWIDVGRPEALRMVNLDRVDATTALGADVRVGEGARVEAPCVIGRGSRLERGAVVAGSLLWEDVAVGAGAVVRDSVLATGVRIGARAHVERAVIAHGAAVGDGARAVDISLDPDARLEPAAAR